jgi:hypothetical protein
MLPWRHSGLVGAETCNPGFDKLSPGGGGERIKPCHDRQP